jgi:hypothetical protein
VEHLENRLSRPADLHCRARCATTPLVWQLTIAIDNGPLPFSGTMNVEAYHNVGVDFLAGDNTAAPAGSMIVLAGNTRYNQSRRVNFGTQVDPGHFNTPLQLRLHALSTTVLAEPPYSDVAGKEWSTVNMPPLTSERFTADTDAHDIVHGGSAHALCNTESQPSKQPLQQSNTVIHAEGLRASSAMASPLRCSITRARSRETPPALAQARGLAALKPSR